MKAPYLVGIAGGSGSGKTTIARSILNALPEGKGLLLEQDHYYRSQGHLPIEEREKKNYDHPEALELTLLAHHLDELKSGVPVERPTYDFSIHDRAPRGETVYPTPVVVVEGIFTLADEALRERFDIKIFVDTDADIRLMRRIRRDLEQRGRTFAQVRKQYYETVRPGHVAFVEPSKRYADIILPEGGENRIALDVLMSYLRTLL
ncbi:MAG: uridine kinase [Polyangiaceae bacterium]|nr:uridine kinase [Polyangiaceae bacterium]